MSMQKELHPAVLAVTDGTVMAPGAGPRTMIPREGNRILASAHQVAIDALAAERMGFDPLAIPYLRRCHERGLGVADPGEIEIVGDDVSGASMGCETRGSRVISPLTVWARFASTVSRDWLWHPTVGRARVRAFGETAWGRLFDGH